MSLLPLQRGNKPHERQVIALGAAGGKDDLKARVAQRRGDLPPYLAHGLVGGKPGPIQSGGIKIRLLHRAAHYMNDRVKGLGSG